MDESTASLVVVVGTAAGALLWILGLLCYRRMLRGPVELTRRTRVAGRAADQVMKGFLRAVATQFPIVERSDNRVAFRLPFALVGIRFDRDGNDVSVILAATLSRSRRLLLWIMAVLVCFLAPGTLIGLSWALLTFAAPSEQPGVRGQVFQIVQAIHVLWPPFLLVFIHKRFVAAAEAFMTNMVTLIEVGE
jgi:hypothetical protein